MIIIRFNTKYVQFKYAGKKNIIHFDYLNTKLIRHQVAANMM